MKDLLTREYRSISSARGPLVFVERPEEAAFGDLVSILVSDTDRREGQVIEIDERYAVIQVFGATERISPAATVVRFQEEGARFGLSELVPGRVFSGAGKPLDGLPPIAPVVRMDVHGMAINPVQRELPRDFIQTGVSAIDGLNTLVRGQKLPIFSGAGLPANELAGMIMANARLREGGEKFAMVFAGMGITSREADYFLDSMEKSGAMERSVAFINLADDPVIERALTPRFALTTAEYLAFELGAHVMVVMVDMTNYCNALREISSAREQIPGRRGYPGYMYTDLAGIYERAGRIKGRKGSITQIPILTMPDDDITHPVPDLTGYITEGQVVLDRGLDHKGIFPPIDPLPSLSRLMDNGIGAGRTREDHRSLADQLYMFYARGVERRRVASITGEEGLSDKDRGYLKFAGEFEKRFIHQGMESRTVDETLDIGWELLEIFPDAELVRISEKLIAIHRRGKGADEEKNENQQA